MTRITAERRREVVEERKCGDGGKAEARTGDGTCSRQPCGSAQSAGPSYKAVNPMPLDSYAVRQAHALEHYGSAVLRHKLRILPSDSSLLVLHRNLALLLTRGVCAPLRLGRFTPQSCPAAIYAICFLRHKPRTVSSYSPLLLSPPMRGA